jgi:hypothetical protein
LRDKFHDEIPQGGNKSHKKKVVHGTRFASHALTLKLQRKRMLYEGQRRLGARSTEINKR